ncbi:MAG: hypothetical protein R3B84_19060 [Zavarzinella sp.]
MADWRKLSKALALADGRIDTKETEIIKKELYADGKIDRSELEWLLDVRKSAQSTVQVFDLMVFDAIKPIVLADGTIDAKEADWLRKFIYADDVVSELEKQFLRELKAAASSVDPSFDKLMADAGC